MTRRENTLFPKLPYRKSHYLRHPRKWLRHAIKNPVKEFYERGRYGWTVADTWSVDGYLNRIVPEMLDYLRKHNHGWPGEPMTIEEWNGDGGIIDQIAHAFRANSAACNMDYLDTDNGRERYDREKHQPMEAALMGRWEEGAALFVKWYNHLWD